MNIKTERGKRGEQQACRFLITRGMRIIERNWRYGKDEIDIIARDKNMIVFVEVKYRTSPVFGYPEESVTRQKQACIRRAMLGYLAQNPSKSYRMDVISIIEGESREIAHIKDVF